VSRRIAGRHRQRLLQRRSDRLEVERLVAGEIGMPNPPPRFTSGGVSADLLAISPASATVARCIR
jgi:hypothetical protein